MSFRHEKKFILNPNNLIHFYKWIEKNECKKIYEKRLVNSLYFDNKNNQMYRDSNEGVLPRKKIRIRNYNNNTSMYLLEKKISSMEGRFKTSIQKKKILNFENNGIFDAQYGLCKPILQVKYLREYFLFIKYRITFDQQIFYSKINSKKEFKDKFFVIEFKGKSINEDFMSFNFPYLENRFSKYCRGFELINGQIPK